jgi:hypothetical protein
MATITASLTLTSPDLTTDSLNLSTSATFTKAGTSTGLTSCTGVARKTTTATTQYVLFDGDAFGNGAHKVYIKNTSSTAAEYVTIEINSEQMGKLYAGDWCLFPWEANADTNDIKLAPSVSTTFTVEYALFYE